jgi:hypothetical protein
MNTKILLVGQVYAIAKKMFEDKETTNVQFLNKLENGGVEILQIKLTINEDALNIKENTNVKIPIKISSYQGKLYYTQVEPILKQ